MLEKIVNNPGLQHIAENIFCNLNYKDLDVCRNINQSCKKILDEPMFWLKIFMKRGLSMKDQLDWTKAIQLTKYTNLKKNILSYLKKCAKNERVVNLPCYINEKIVENSKNLTKQYLKPFINRLYGELFNACFDGDEGIIQILAPLMPNPNLPDKKGWTPIQLAASCGDYFEPIIQILAPLTSNPNARNRDWNPIYTAAKNSCVEVVQILAPLIDHPNEPDEDGQTPIHAAVSEGALEVVKILAPLTNNPNPPDKTDEWTPMHEAAWKGNIEIIKFLAPLIDELNPRDKDGDTPIDVATQNGHHEIVKYLESYQKPSKRARLE